MTEQPADPPGVMDVATFREWHDGTDTRYELINGRPVAMNPPAPAHSELCGNATLALGRRLPGGCRILTEMGTVFPGRDDQYFQADVGISCTPREPGARETPEPLIIVEVLSPSTIDHDKGWKGTLYREIPSLQDILFVDSTRVRVEHWRREGEGWFILDVIGRDSAVTLKALDLTLPLADVYDGVALEDEDA